MEWHSIDSWIIIIGILAAVSCALLGNFLVLRRMSMMGDAISHAVLPGLAIAYLVTHSRTSIVMFVGAAVAGLMTVLLTEWICRRGKVDRGAAMGIVFTTFFSLGLLLIVQAADHVDLDPGCVLYGSIELAPLDVAWRIDALGFSFALPRAVFVLSPVLLLNTIFILLFFKELRLASFDPELARTQGLPVSVLHYGLMALVAVTTVATFEAVGSILVIAMLVVPPSVAFLLTRRLISMVFISLLIAAASAALGHILALLVPNWLGYESTSTSGMIAVAGGAILVIALIFSPTDGLLVMHLKKRKLQST